MQDVPRFLLPLLLLATSGCNSGPDVRHAEIAAISADHRTELQRFEEARRALERRYPAPMRLEFPGQGTVIVHESTLRGFPGAETFWFRYTYVNTTGHDIHVAHVDFRLRDPRGGEERWIASDLRLPLGFLLTPQSSYTTFVELPLAPEQVHTGLEWKLDVQLEAEAGSPELHQRRG